MIHLTYLLFEHLDGLAIGAVSAAGLCVLFAGVCEFKWRRETRRTRQTRSLMECEVWGNDERKSHGRAGAGESETGDDCSVSVLSCGEGESVPDDNWGLAYAPDASWPAGGIPPFPGEA